jgi:hypothetical protein
MRNGVYFHNEPIMVKQIDLISGNALRVFKSMREAGRKTGISMGSISSCCNGVRVTAGGYGWSKFSN